MPSGYCPRCGATYDSPTLTANGPVCRYCLPRGDVVVLLPARRARFTRPHAAAGELTILRERARPTRPSAPGPG